jgi:hypothetical protein
VDALLGEVGGGIPGKFFGKFVREGHIVGLEVLDARGLGVGEDDRAERLARGRVGAVVDAGDAGAEGHREGRLDVLDLHVVEDDRLEVAHGLGGAVEGGELALLDCE